MRAHLFRRAATLLVICSLGLASACTNDSEPEPLPPETSTPTPTETTTAPATAADEASAALAKFFELRDEFYRTRLVTKKLNEVATGDANVEVQGVVRELREDTMSLAAPYEHELGEPKKITAKSFEIVDCELEPDWIFEGKPVKKTGPDGRPLANPRPTRFRIEQIDDLWLVTESFWMGNRSC